MLFLCWLQHHMLIVLAKSPFGIMLFSRMPNCDEGQISFLHNFDLFSPSTVSILSFTRITQCCQLLWQLRSQKWIIILHREDLFLAIFTFCSFYPNCVNHQRDEVGDTAILWAWYAGFAECYLQKADYSVKMQLIADTWDRSIEDKMI